MKHRNKAVAIGVFFGILFLIIYSKQTILSAAAGINLCLQSVIPALFPLMVLTSILSASLSQNPSVTGTIKKIFKMPESTVKFLFLGLLGGYPTGAIHINNAVQSGELSSDTGCKLLMFCSNAGPAFLFGMGCTLFDRPLIPLVIWIVHILSALLLSKLIHIPSGSVSTQKEKHLSVSKILEGSIKNMALICGWVILFHIFTDMILQFLNGIPLYDEISLCLGFLEISNGSLLLNHYSSSLLRILMFSLYINSGGVCVAMQTFSAVPNLRFSNYIIGKLLQTVISFLLLLLFLPLLTENTIPAIYCILSAVFLMAIFLSHKLKKTVAFTVRIPYNKKIQKG